MTFFYIIIFYFLYDNYNSFSINETIDITVHILLKHRNLILHILCEYAVISIIESYNKCVPLKRGIRYQKLFYLSDKQIRIFY